MDGRIDRRALLQGAGVAGAGLAAGGLSAATPAEASAWKRGRGRPRLVVDVAVLGDTNFPNEYAAANAPGRDFRGSSYYYEGLVYPAGTIDPSQGLFDPESAEATGNFFDTGWVMIHPARPNPHLLATHHFFLDGPISADNLYPRDSIVTSGLENSNLQEESYARAVHGGSGRYARARGEVIQERLGRNVTDLINFSGPFVPKAPNYRFHFYITP